MIYKSLLLLQRIYLFVNKVRIWEIAISYSKFLYFCRWQHFFKIFVILLCYDKVSIWVYTSYKSFVDGVNISIVLKILLLILKFLLVCESLSYIFLIKGYRIFDISILKKHKILLIKKIDLLKEYRNSDNISINKNNVHFQKHKITKWWK